MSKKTVQKVIETVTDYGEGFEEGIKVGLKDGYEKGLRDMWEATQQTCSKKTFISCSNSAACGETIEKENNVATCHFKNCPIAQKLLKAVK